ncbi:glycosyltransferase family 32 protein [Tenacibaculum crassostreae]|uniref:glycosyltransferase family 32 protein n=1 Tax=Tenacibaculum crassostreae TaxID=502683 RepID=UPI003895E849
MIPKIIHYCWFGGNPLPPLAVKCIASWKKYLPEYEIIEWNESNFDLEQYLFAKEALENRKFAFVSDVCRLHALKEIGGVYMDTDVEVLRGLDPFLEKKAFSGFENDDFVPTGIMASEKDGVWVTEMLAYYDGRSFVKEDGELDTTSNTKIITDLMIEKGFVMNNSFQEVEDYIAFYPNDFFCPKSYKTGNIELTENSYCIHHFAKSWISPTGRWRNIIKMKVMNVFGAHRVQKVIDLIKK